MTTDRPTIQRDRRKGYVVMSERALYALLAIAAVAVVIAIAVSAYSVVVVHKLNSTAATLSDIQASRLDSCNETNERHDRTFAVLDAEVQALAPAKRAKAQESLPQTKALLEALAPKRDCVKVVGPLR